MRDASEVTAPDDLAGVTLIGGDCVDVMREMVERCERVQAIVTDPPYHLTSIVERFGKPGRSRTEATAGKEQFGRLSRGFMGKEWDGGDIAFQPETWRLCWDLLPPGGHLAAFGGTRGFHRMACAIEDAGFEIRDCLMWLYGTGFPKSHNLDGEWEGWGTALKPAWEPIVLARKPIEGTVAATMLAHGVGALNIDACRIAGAKPDRQNIAFGAWREMEDRTDRQLPGQTYHPGEGRWPANVVHDGSEEVEAAFAAYGERGAFAPVRGTEPSAMVRDVLHARDRVPGAFHGDTGSAARFFYSAKATRSDRNSGCDAFEERALSWSSGEQSPGTFQAEGTHKAARNPHPTVKPTALMQWLARMVTPPGGMVLDPFMGSGSTGRACRREGFRFIGIERDPEYLAIARARIAAALEPEEPEPKAAPIDPRQSTIFDFLNPQPAAPGIK